MASLSGQERRGSDVAKAPTARRERVAIEQRVNGCELGCRARQVVGLHQQLHKIDAREDLRGDGTGIREPLAEQGFAFDHLPAQREQAGEKSRGHAPGKPVAGAIALVSAAPPLGLRRVPVARTQPHGRVELLIGHSFECFARLREAPGVRQCHGQRPTEHVALRRCLDHPRF